MARPKLYDKRFHFNGPAELDTRARALAERRTASGVDTTPSDVLREALTVGLDAMESCARYAHETGQSPRRQRIHGAEALLAATDTLDRLVELGDALSTLDVDVLRALADVDVDVLRGLGRLDCDILDALAQLDTDGLVALERLDADAVAQFADTLAN